MKSALSGALLFLEKLQSAGANAWLGGKLHLRGELVEKVLLDQPCHVLGGHFGERDDRAAVVPHLLDNQLENGRKVIHLLFLSVRGSLLFDDLLVLPVPELVEDLFPPRYREHIPLLSDVGQKNMR